MLKVKEYVDKTRENALGQCLDELHVSEDDLYIRESETEAKLFKAKKVKLEVLPKQDIIQYVKEYIDELSQYLQMEIHSEVKFQDGILQILLVSDHNSLLIGKDGRTMNSIQQVLRQSISAKTGFKVSLMVDVSNYKEKQNYFFEKEVKKICREVLKSHVDVKLDPMNSYKRRLVHSVVNEYDHLTTKSEGTEPRRYVVIQYQED